MTLPRLSEKETDMRDKLDPSISYLRKLGPEYINQVFESSRWIFEEDRHMAFEVILVYISVRFVADNYLFHSRYLHLMTLNSLELK